MPTTPKPTHSVLTAPAAGATVLRSYQEEALQAVVQAAERGARRLLVVAPVGSGKTLLAARLPERFGEGRMLYVCHREELLRQTLRVFKYERPDRTASIERAEAQADPTSQTVVATIQSLASPSRLARYDPTAWPLLVADEAHRSTAESYLKAFRYFRHLADPEANATTRLDGLLLGLTGTSRRTDQVGLGIVFDEIPFTVTLRALIEQQYLAPLCGYLLRGGADLERIQTHQAADGERDYEPRALARAINTPARNRLIVEGTHELALKDGRPTIVFACDIAHTEALAQAFQAAGVRAAALHSGMSREARVELLDQFRYGTLQVAVNCEILVEGVDLPMASAIVMARPTRSNILFQQAIGRGIRLSPQTGKTDCLVIDFVDNASEHAGTMMTLPTLFGLPPQMDLKGEVAHEIVAQLEVAARALETGLDDATLQQIRSPEDIPRIFREFDFWKIAAIPPEVSAYTNLTWQRLATGAYNLFIPRALPVPVPIDQVVLAPQDPVHDEGGQLVIEENALGHAEIRYRVGTSPATKIRETPDLASAFRFADTIITTQYSDRLRLLSKDAPWRHRPASRPQLELLVKLGMKVSRTLTSGQASLLINNAKALRLERSVAHAAKLGEPATTGQLRYLRFLHITVTPGLTKRDTGRLIRDAKNHKSKNPSRLRRRRSS